VAWLSCNCTKRIYDTFGPCTSEKSFTRTIWHWPCSLPPIQYEKHITFWIWLSTEMPRLQEKERIQALLYLANDVTLRQVNAIKNRYFIAKTWRSLSILIGFHSCHHQKHILIPWYTTLKKVWIEFFNFWFCTLTMTSMAAKKFKSNYCMLKPYTNPTFWYQIY